MDPNWFYSTLAQSTAAIVGLTGGFLAQQLLAQRREVAQLREPVRNRAAHHYTNWVERTRNAAVEVIASLGEVAARVREAADKRTWIREIPAGTNVAVLAPPPQGVVSATRGLAGEPLSATDLPAIERGRTVAIALRDSLPKDFPSYAESLRLERGLGKPTEEFLVKQAWSTTEKPQPGPGFKNWLVLQEDVAAELWAGAEREMKPIAEHLGNFRARLVPPAFYWLLGILSALLAAGVVAPMFFLSARGDSSRPLLLVVFIPMAFALLGFFALELRRLRRADRLASDTF